MRWTIRKTMAALGSLLTFGCGDASSVGELDPLTEPPAFAVVSSDYSSSAVGFLDADGEVIVGSWIHSGTTEPGIVATLSGDVVLPTVQAEGSFTLIDRFRTDVVTRFRMPEGELIGQVRTHGDPMETGYSSNPYDYVHVDDATAWVTRFGVQVDADEPAENQGNDLLRIDPTAMERTDVRVPLSTFDTTATTMTDDGPVEVTAYARPSGAVRVDDAIVVALSRLSLGFDASAPGVVALVSTEGNVVGSAPLGELHNCGRVAPVPGSVGRVLVGCSGFAFPFDEGGAARDSGGLVLLDVDEGGVHEVVRWEAADHPNAAPAVQSSTPLDDGTVVAVAFGSRDGDVPDRLYRVELETGAQALLHESSEPFAIGSPAYDPATGLLLVPDATDGVHRFRIRGDAVIEEGVVEVAPELLLPVRQVRRM
ncbi:MAG: hypothetical protein ACODAU_01615 [Myxococcota bacterium]